MKKWLFVIILGGWNFLTEFGLKAAELESLHQIDISTKPSTITWQKFLRSDFKIRKRLWEYHERRGIRWISWNWAWRMAWVRACGPDPIAFCRPVLEKALKDPALVVRAEAATQMGNRYSRTKNKKITQSLIRALRNRRNYRNNKPLYVQNRILYALYLVNGNTNLSAADQIIARYPQLRAYWKKLSYPKKS